MHVIWLGNTGVNANYVTLHSETSQLL